nr:hypothetical protein [Nocardia sp. CS682]
MQDAKFLPRFDTQLIHQQVAGLSVDVQRLGLTAARVQRTHQHHARTFPQWVFRREDTQPIDHLIGTAQCHSDIEAVLHHREPPFGQRRALALRERAGQSGERFTGIQGEGLRVTVFGAGPIAGFASAARLPDQPVEHAQIGLLVLDPQLISAVTGQQQHRWRAWFAVRLEYSAQRGHVRLDHADPAGRRHPVVQRGEQARRRHPLPTPEGQYAQHGPALRRAERKDLLAAVRFHPVEQRQPHRGRRARDRLIHPFSTASLRPGPTRVSGPASE